MIDACVGSGKTLTLIHRIRALIEEGVSESSIVLCTFTRAAASEMSCRLDRLLGRQSQVRVGTIDALALSAIEKYAGHYQLD